MTWLGSQHAQQALIIVAGLSALLMLEPVPTSESAVRRDRSWPERSRSSAAAVIAALLARNMPPVPPILVAYGRYAATRIGQADIIYMGEGWNASVAVSAAARRRAQLSQRRQGPGVERAAGHAPAADAGPPHDADSEGSEAGTRHRLRRRRHRRSGLDRSEASSSETIAEIEPLVPRVVSTYFAEHNFDVVTEPEDARPARRRAALPA